MAFSFGQDEEVGASLQRLAGEQLDKALGHLLGSDPDRDDAIHEARKSLKRLRALANLARVALGEDAFQRENACYRDVGLQLSGLRDATVLLATLDQLLSQARPRVRRDRFAGVRRRLEQRRQSAYADSGSAVAETVVNQLRWARVRAADWPVAMASWAELEAGLCQVYARGRRALRTALMAPSDEAYHDWRKWAKYLWYHTQMLAPSWPAVAAAVAAELDEVGEVLGQDHDLSVLRQVVSTELGQSLRAATVQALLALIDDQQAVLRQRAVALGRRLYAERPRAYGRRQRAIWQAWRQPPPAALMPPGPRATGALPGLAAVPRAVADFACVVGENPLWHARERRLYWVDINTGRLCVYDPATQAASICFAGDPIGGFTVQADGSLLLFMARGAIARWRDGHALQTVIPEIAAERESRFNDVIADPEGRVFCGTMPTGDHPGRLYRLDRDGRLTVVRQDVGCSNGLAFGLDHRSLYYTDSACRVIYRYAYDRATGALTDEQVFLDTSDQEGVPDGLTIDAEGCLWSARWDGGCLERYAPDGQRLARIAFPARKVSSVTFGGRECRQLYVTTAGGDQRDLEGVGAGALFELDLGIRGVPEFVSRVGL